MINIIWIDPNSEELIRTLKRENLTSITNVAFFARFKDGLSYLQTTSSPIHLIISTYSSLTWHQVFVPVGNEQQDYSTCFEFFDKLCAQEMKIPYLLYTTMHDFDSRSKLYQQKPNFTVIKKFDSYGLRHYLYQLYDAVTKAS